MNKRRMSYMLKTVALVMAGVIGLCGLETDAAQADEFIEIPEDTRIEEIQNSLELQTYTLYTYDGDVVGQFYYGESGELYRSVETMEYVVDDKYKVKKIWDIRPYDAYADIRLYTYRYLEDKTLCYMDFYENGLFQYGAGWAWDAEGKEQLYVKYDSDMNMESVECSYYDEEGRIAYELSGLSDLEDADLDETEIHSYEYDKDWTVIGYVQNGKNGVKEPNYLKEAIDQDTLLEANYTRGAMDELVWNSYDEEGRLVYKISVETAWKQVYSQANLVHYVYDDQGRIKAEYSYDVVDDISVQDTGIYSDQHRSFSLTMNRDKYPEWIVSDCSLTDKVVVQYDNVTGAFLDITMGDN